MKQAFIDAMDDDLDSGGAFVVLFELLSFVEANKEKLSKEQGKLLRDLFTDFDKVFGFIESLYSEYMAKLKSVMEDDSVKSLVEKRIALRNSQSFEQADKIRNELEENYGLIFRDTKAGTVVDFLSVF